MVNTIKFDNDLCFNYEGKLSCVFSSSGSGGFEYEEENVIHNINN